MPQDEINQTRCWIATGGHLWMEGYFDTLPATVRQRLRNSPFNLCAACLVTKFAPELRRQRPNIPRGSKLLLAAIEIMEAQARQGT
jgi:hypothetical protein